MDNGILERALGLGGAVVTGWEERGGGVFVDARPRGAGPRRPVCGRRRGAYDTLAARLWRAPDLGTSRCLVRHAPARVECPGHGVRAARVPWASHAFSPPTGKMLRELGLERG